MITLPKETLEEPGLRILGPRLLDEVPEDPFEVRTKQAGVEAREATRPFFVGRYASLLMNAAECVDRVAVEDRKIPIGRGISICPVLRLGEASCSRSSSSCATRDCPTSCARTRRATTTCIRQ